MVVETVAQSGDLGMIRMRGAVLVVADLGRLIEARCAVRGPLPGLRWSISGRWSMRRTAQFDGNSDMISAHPPWKASGSGIAFARYAIDLPAEGPLELATEVALDPGAVGPGKSDGVTFAAVARCGNREIRGQVHNATAQQRPLHLDLTPLAGKRVTVELSVDPGPKRDPSFDWARWHRPRIVSVPGDCPNCGTTLRVVNGDGERRTTSGRRRGTLAVAGGGPWEMAIGPAGAVPIRAAGDSWHTEVPLPGTVFLLRARPDAVQLPLDLSQQPWSVILLSDSGQALPSRRMPV